MVHSEITSDDTKNRVGICGKEDGGLVCRTAHLTSMDAMSVLSRKNIGGRKAEVKNSMLYLG